MSKLEVPFPVGIVSAFYFIIFDLFLLTVVDLVLSRVANSLYYRRINNGHPLIVKSADIPGITTFLIGRYFSLPNIIGIAIKVFFLLCIVMIERGIEAERSKSVRSHTLSGTFKFDPSEAEWGDSPYHRVVARRWERTRLCREFDKNDTDSKSFTFYHIAFNLTSEQELEDERNITTANGLIDINDRSIRCLSPKKVVEEDVKPLQQVVGCSNMFPTENCRNETIIRLSVNGGLPYAYDLTGDDPKVYSVPVGTGFISLSIVTHTLTELLPLFPQFANTSLYRNPELTCARTRMGPSHSNSKMYRSCILIVLYQGNNTLVERWTHDIPTDTLVRSFPGPIFKGDIEFAMRQRANHLTNVVFAFNWVSFAGSLVADGVVYRKVDWTFQTFKNSLVTAVPVYAVVLGIVLLFIAIVAKIVIIFTIGRDLRPQLNQIDGISSVAREELAPCGRSMVSGRGVLLGLSHRGWGKHLHFGPLMTYRECARRSDGELVE